MSVFTKRKDGGPESPVDGYFLCEFKGLFSIALLKFNKGCREQFHTHAFNAWTWFLSGDLVEEDVFGDEYRYGWSIFPKKTPREKCHRVRADRDSWCLTFRGPWSDNWSEYDPETKKETVFTWGRKVVTEYDITISKGDIPLMVRSQQVFAKTRKLKAYWSSDPAMEGVEVETA